MNNNYYYPNNNMNNYGNNLFQRDYNYQHQQPQQQSLSIKGKYINSLDEVVQLQSSDLEPAVCVNLLDNKIYIKTFNVDGSYTVEEFVKNDNAKLDTRSQAEKLNDVVNNLAKQVENLSEDLNSLKSDLGSDNNIKSKKGGN